MSPDLPGQGDLHSRGQGQDSRLGHLCCKDIGHLRMGLCLPLCGRSLSSSDFSLPQSDHSGASLSTDRFTASSLSIPSTFSVTDRSSSYGADNDRAEDLSQTARKQVCSQAESNPRLYEEDLRNPVGCGYSGEEATPSEERFGFDPEGKLPARSAVEDETIVKRYAEARVTPDMTSAWSDQVGRGEDGGCVRLSDKQLLSVTVTEDGQVLEPGIVDDFRHDIITAFSVEIDKLDEEGEDSESRPMLSTSSLKDCAIGMEGHAEPPQAKHAFSISSEEEEVVDPRRMGTGSELAAGPSESSETLINPVRLEGLRSQVALGFRRLCGRYSRLGLFVSSHKKFVKVSCGHFWVSLALLLLLALPMLIITKGVFSANYELIVAGSILLSFQFALCFWLKKQMSV